ncbi:MSCRAMM family protein [Paludibaculum fermentans]|uniref:MSCRAMM family protein n=1 Tax=Paludibaculum fermentans TaxID=1473598 RepID=UPI003EC081F5
MRNTLLLIFVAAICWSQDQPAEYTIAGTVIDSVSRRPMGRIRVVVSPMSRPAAELAAGTTGEDGNFQFQVPKGTYTLRAQRNGLMSQSYGSESLRSDFGVAVITGPGQSTANLTFALHPPASISGTVLDEAGEPVEAANVQLLHATVIAGRKSVSTMAWGRTNDLGEYRFSGLGSGEYFLGVTGKPWFASNQLPEFGGAAASSELLRTAFVPMYYPNTSDPRAAAPLQVKPGQDAVANFALFTKPGFSLTILCESCAGKMMRMDVLSEGIHGTQSYQQTEYLYGRKVIPAIPPGQYEVLVKNQDPAKPLSAAAKVDLSAGDAEVTLSPQESARVIGQVMLREADPRLVRRLFVSLLSEDNLSRGFSRELAADGTFQLPVTTAGRYRLLITGVPGVYASQVTSEDSALRDGVLDIGTTTQVRVNVVASGSIGRAKGFVRRKGEPVPGVLVVLASAALPSDPLGYLGYLTDSDGSFDFKNIRPGEYRLFALTDSRFEYANPAAVRPYLAAAKPLVVAKSSLIEEDLELP